MSDTSQNSVSERPITEFSADRLNRIGFVERIADGLITDDGKASRGVVIGVTGAWGSGKSSILNLVDQEIRKRSPAAVVVRFDPWVISGQQDLILAFLRETIRTIAAEPERAKRARKLIDGLSHYAVYLAPVFNAALKGAGDVAKGLLQSLKAQVDGDQSLLGQRKKLEELITTLGVPVVVLIDELDRVEDDEVRAVAQLVRAVGDFSGISYLLAYDPTRVAKALGRSDPEHGRAYLEKIVQLPLSLPVALPEELRAMLDAELKPILFKLELEGAFSGLRYDDIAEAITPRLASTPRDVKRLVGIFHPLMAMVKTQVDPVDVLGFAALMAKAPLTVERISAHPDIVVDDPLSFEEAVRRIDARSGNGTAAKVVQEPQAQALVSRLFPALSGRDRSDDHHHNAISQRRGLLTVLRLGLLPNTSKTAAEILLGSDAEHVSAEFEKAVESDALPEVLEGLAAIYTDRFDADDLSFWRGASSYLNRENLPDDVRYALLPNLAENLEAMLHSAATRRPDAIGKARRIVNELLIADDMTIAPLCLSRHLAIHGLGPNGRQDKAGGGPWFLSAGDTASLTNNAVNNWKSAVQNGRFFTRLNTVEPLRIMARLAHWDDVCKSALTNDLISHVPRLATIFYAQDQMKVSAAFIQVICGVAEFASAAKQRLRMGGLSDLEKKALEFAVSYLPDSSRKVSGQ